MCGGAQRRARARITDEIRAITINRVINQQVGYCMRASPTAKCTFCHVLR